MKCTGLFFLLLISRASLGMGGFERILDDDQELEFFSHQQKDDSLRDYGTNAGKKPRRMTVMATSPMWAQEIKLAAEELRQLEEGDMLALTLKESELNEIFRQYYLSWSFKDAGGEEMLRRLAARGNYRLTFSRQDFPKAFKQALRDPKVLCHGMILVVGGLIGTIFVFVSAHELSLPTNSSQVSFVDSSRHWFGPIAATLVITGSILQCCYQSARYHFCNFRRKNLSQGQCDDSSDSNDNILLADET